MANPLPEPVYFKHSDVYRRSDELRSLEVCKAVAKVIECTTLIDGAQNHKGTWKIYLKCEDTRAKLLSKGLTLRGKRVTLYDQDPRLPNNKNLRAVTERILIKDIPLSVSNDVILESLKEIAGDIKFTSPMKYSVERDEDGTRTDFKNGDRFIFAEAPISPPLPFDFHVGGHSGRLYHDSQEKTCRVCGQSGHRFRSDNCPAYDTNLKHFPFKSHENKLSNFWPCKVEYRDNTFNSSEHAWYHTIATELGLPETAQQIKAAKHAGAAKAIARKQIPREMIDNWEEQCGMQVMTEIVQNKVFQNEDVALYLKNTGSTILVEATPDKVWGSGLFPHQVRVTKPDYWPGQNLLGQILMKIRESITSISLSDDILVDEEWEDEHPVSEEYLSQVREAEIADAEKTAKEKPVASTESKPARGRQAERIKTNHQTRSRSPSARPSIARYFRSRDNTPDKQPIAATKTETPKRRASGSPSQQKSTKLSKTAPSSKEGDGT